MKTQRGVLRAISIRIKQFVYAAAVIAALHIYAPESNAQVIHFDGIADGNVIDWDYAYSLGVILSNPLGPVYARSSPLAPSTPNVVSIRLSGYRAFDANFGAVDATFTEQRHGMADLRSQLFSSTRVV